MEITVRKNFVISILLFLTYCICQVYAAPPNDLCQNAIAISESIPYIGDSQNATGTSASSCSFNDTADVWHSLVPSENGNYTISLCGSSFDTTLSIYDACDGVELACNDDMCGVSSEVVVDLTVGQNYLIRIAGYDNAAGEYILLATKRPSPPINDEFADAVLMFEDITYEGDTSETTKPM